MQLTYRQLLQRSNQDVLLDILTEKTKLDYKAQDVLSEKEIVVKALQTAEAYKAVIAAVLAKPVNERPSYALILTLGQDFWEDRTEDYVKVSYYNSRVDWLPEGTRYEQYMNNNCKYLGFGFDQWSFFSDCDVVLDPLVVIKLGADNLLEKIAAEILWEQTFYGFTEEHLTSFVEVLKQRAEDITNGKIETVKLKKKKGDKYEVHIPKDMLAPEKKKRSNKKKK